MIFTVLKHLKYTWLQWLFGWNYNSSYSSYMFWTTVWYATQIIFSHLHICSGLVCDLHDELAAFSVWLAHQVVQYIQVYRCSQVIDVGDKNVLLPFSDELLQQTRVIKAGVNVTMTRRIPHICILSCHSHVISYRQQWLLIYPWIPGKFRREKVFSNWN